MLALKPCLGSCCKHVPVILPCGSCPFEQLVDIVSDQCIPEDINRLAICVIDHLIIAMDWSQRRMLNAG